MNNPMSNQRGCIVTRILRLNNFFFAKCLSFKKVMVECFLAFTNEKTLFKYILWAFEIFRNSADRYFVDIYQTP